MQSLVKRQNLEDRLVNFFSRKFYQIFFICLLAVGFSFVFSLRGFYSDGAYNLFKILIKGGFDLYETARSFSHTIMQIPAVLFVHLNGNKISKSLLFIYQTGLLVIPLGSILLAYLATPARYRSELFFIFSAFLSTAFLGLEFGVATIYTTTALVLMAATLIRFFPLHKLLNQVFFLACIGLLFRSHELMFYCGPLLIVCLFLRAKNANKPERQILWMAKLIIAYISIESLYLTIFPTNIGNRELILNTLVEGVWFFGWNSYQKSYFISPGVGFSLILTLTVVSHLSNKKFFFYVQNIFYLLLVTHCICLISAPIFFNSYLRPADVYNTRLWPAFLIFVLLTIWILLTYNTIKIYRLANLKAVVALACICLSLWQVLTNIRHHQYINQVSTKLSSCYGLIDISSNKIWNFEPSGLIHFSVAGWSLPALSILISKNQKVKSVFFDTDLEIPFKFDDLETMRSIKFTQTLNYVNHLEKNENYCD